DARDGDQDAPERSFGDAGEIQTPEAQDNQNADREDEHARDKKSEAANAFAPLLVACGAGWRDAFADRLEDDMQTPDDQHGAEDNEQGEAASQRRLHRIERKNAGDEGLHLGEQRWMRGRLSLNHVKSIGRPVWLRQARSS